MKVPLLSRYLLSLGASCAAAMVIAAGAEPDALSIKAPSAPSVGFAGTELAIPMKLRNGGRELLPVDLSFRFYQRSSSTLQPLQPPEAWWHGTLEPSQELTVPLKVVLPELPGPAAFRVRVLDREHKALAYAEAIAIPRGWLVTELQALGKPLALYSPDASVAQAFADSGVSVERLHSIEAADLPRGKLILLVPSADEESNVGKAYARLAASRIPAILFLDHAPPPEFLPRSVIGAAADLRALASSAGAQYRFIALVKQALASPAENR